MPADWTRRFLRAPVPFPIRFGDYPRDQVELVKDAYAEALAYSDSQLGRLFDALRRSGRWDRTLVVVTGDTGQAFFEHGFAAHANALFEEVVRVPLIVRAPGLAPRADRRAAQHVDVAPTLFELLGLPPHPGHQGRSLLGRPPPLRSVYLVAQCALAHQVGIVRGGYKLIHDERFGRSLLFDLRSDPGERRPLRDDDPRFAEITRRLGLLGRLATWRRLQLDYHADARLQQRTWPPVLGD